MKRIMITPPVDSIPSKRDERIDSVKFWLMVLVIAGHVLPLFGYDANCIAMHQWIYIFHMPLFIFISGYYSRKKDFRHFLLSCWTLLEPLILLQILIMVGLTCLKGGNISIQQIFTPWGVLWYLLSLICWRTFLQIIPDKLLHSTTLIIASFVISMFAGFLPFHHFLSLQRTFSFLPFFCIGYCMKGKSLFINSKYRIWSLLFLILSIIASLWLSKHLHLNLFNLSDPYSNIYDMYERIVVLCLSIPISIAFLNICPYHKWTAIQGRYTMQYYLYHALILIILVRMDWTNLPMPFFMATICVAVITIGIAMILKIPCFQKLTNPSRFFSKVRQK